MADVRMRSDERPGEVWEFRVLRTWFQRMRGLLGTGPGALPVVLVGCRSIHTVGMGYAIDVAFLGERGEVLRSLRGVGPGGARSCPDAVCTVERPAADGPWPEEGEHLWVVSVSFGGGGLRAPRRRRGFA